MHFRTLLALAGACLALSACGESVSPPLPPLLQDASAGGGSNFLCEPGSALGSTPETASHSPQIVERLRRDFPPGTQAKKLRAVLVQQGFRLHIACSPDGSVSWAEFTQKGGDGITAMAASGMVYWKEDRSGRLVWATGNIGFRGL
jgi:hypothetical protein